MKWNSYIEGLKWAGLKQVLYDIAETSSVSLNITSEDKGLVRTFIEYSIEGEEKNINKFKRILAASIEEYNS